MGIRPAAWGRLQRNIVSSALFAVLPCYASKSWHVNRRAVLGALPAGREFVRRFVVEMLDDVGVEGPWLRRIRPKAQYASLFAQGGGE